MESSAFLFYIEGADTEAINGYHPRLRLYKGGVRPMDIEDRVLDAGPGTHSCMRIVITDAALVRG